MSKIGRGSDQFMLRLPDGLREQIKADALSHDRSMNAEIIARLSGTQANLRDEIAMRALNALGELVTIDRNDEVTRASMSVVARYCYAFADAMLAEREKGGEK